jgi:hypoxanthine phosphoribosyltransferase
MSNWKHPVEILYSAEAIAERVRDLGARITADYAHSPGLCIVGVLKGSFVFYADLVRSIHLPVQCEFIGISSYGNNTESSGVVRIVSDLSQSVENMDVLIVEDIVDTGLSMRYLIDNFATRKPRSIRVCTLLEKPANARIKIPIDYKGFVIPNEFVVGYGLDAGGVYRNLPYIGVLRS